MKNTLLIFSLASLIQVNAQFTFSTGKEISLEITAPYQTGEVHCVPNPVSDMSITWNLLEMDANLPSGWIYTICDQICYPFFENHGTPVDYTESQFTDGQYYKLKLGVTVNGIEGSGYVKYYIHDAVNTTFGDTVIFHLNYQVNGLAENNLSGNEVSHSISNGILSLLSKSEKEVDIQLISSSGVSIYQTKFQQQAIIDQVIPAGIYFLIVDNTTTQKIVIF